MLKSRICKTKLMRKLITLFLLVISFTVYAQDWPVKKQVLSKKAINVPFTKINPFSFIASRPFAKQGTYQQLRLNPSFNKQLMEQRPEALQLTIPLSSSKTITCDLVQFSLGYIKYTENNDGIINNVREPVTFRGIIEGEKNKNTVTLTANDDYLSLIAVTGNNVIQLAQADETDKSLYRLYDASKIQFPQAAPLDCGTKEDATTSLRTQGIDLTGGTPTAIQDKCVNVFVDCFDSLYISRNRNRQQTINFVYELFNSVTTGYYNDSINIQITTINVWTTTDPFRGDTRENALADLANNYKDNFFGNICVGLDFSTIPIGRSGLADAIGKVKAVLTNTCPAYTAGNSPFCYNDLNYNVTVRNFPTGLNTTGQQVYLVMHEMGHLLGSRHTKWCGWKLTSNPDTFGALDSCGTTEGGCAKGAPPGGSGATIMSYCVGGNSANDYVGYFNGFGVQPGNAIRSFINGSPCILNCSDCFGALNKSKNDDYAFYPGIKNNNENNSNGQTQNTGKQELLIVPQKIKQ